MSKPRIRCSELNQFLACPGSRTVRSIVADREGDEGIEGTMIHWEIAWRLVNELGAVQPDGGLPPPKGVPPGYKIPGFSSWIVDWAFRTVQTSVPGPWALEVEPELEWEFEHWVLTGHLDVAGTSPDGKQANDFDWKTGIVPVDPAEVNEQVCGYMVLRRMIYGVESATFSIGQPKNDEDEGFERLSTVSVIGADKLDALVSTLNARVVHALGMPMDLDTGPQCKYCVGLACPGLRELERIMKFKLTPEHLAGMRKVMPDPELVDIVADARTLKKPIEDAEDILKERLEGGKVLVGASGLTAKVVESPGGYSTVDPVGMFKWLQTTIPNEMPMALSYPSGKVRDALAKGLSIPKDGKAPVTAKSVFEGAAASYLKPKVKHTLVLS